MADQVTLVAEAAFGGDRRRGTAGSEKRTRPIEPNQRLKPMRRDAVPRPKGRGKMLRTEASLVRGLSQRHASRRMRVDEIPSSRQRQAIRRRPTTSCSHARQHGLHQIAQALLLGHAAIVPGRSRVQTIERAGRHRAPLNHDADARLDAELRGDGVPSAARNIQHVIVRDEGAIDRILGGVGLPRIDDTDGAGWNVRGEAATAIPAGKVGAEADLHGVVHMHRVAARPARRVLEVFEQADSRDSGVNRQPTLIRRTFKARASGLRHS